MSRLLRVKPAVLSGLLLLPAIAPAQFTVNTDATPPPSGQTVSVSVPVTNVSLGSDRMSQRTRVELIRLMESEFAFTRIPIPRGEKGITLKANGSITPAAADLNSVLLKEGAAAKLGQRVQITGIAIRDRDIRFEIDGGPKGKEKWYQHIQVGGTGGWTPIGGPQQQQRAEDPQRGAVLLLAFDKFVPEIDAEQLRELLSPVFDFSLKSPMQQYADTLSPKTRAAVLNHKALVGMSRDMVLNAKGAPGQKVRETDNGQPYEEWIYGEPPGEVEFVRFVDSEVVRIETLPFGKAPIIRTAREVDTPVKVAEAKPPQPEQDQPPQQTASAAPAKAPTMRRPGEGVPDANQQPAGDAQVQTRRIGFPNPTVGEAPLPGPQLPPQGPDITTPPATPSPGDQQPTAPH